MLFLGVAWVALQLGSGSRLGVLLSPLVAQAGMALVAAFGIRIKRKVAMSAPRRSRSAQLPVSPLVAIALGGFLLQASVLSLIGPMTAGRVPGLAPVIEAPLAWSVLVLTSVVGAPLLEELFFRGTLQPMLGRRSAIVGIVSTAALFGAAHGFETPLRAIPTFFQGLVLGSVMLLTGRLAASVLVHAANNVLVVAALALIAHRPESLAGSGAFAGMAPVAALGAVGALLLACGLRRINALPEYALASAPAPAHRSRRPSRPPA